MDLYMDDRLEVRGVASIADALQEARVLAGEGRRLIVAVRIDGEHASDDVLEMPPTGPSGAKEIRFETAAMADVVREAMEEVGESLRAASAAQDRCERLILSGEVEKAVSNLGDVVDHWQRVRTGVEACALLLGATPGTLRVEDGRTLEELATTLRAGLEEVKRALRTEDWSALGDVLHHEMAREVGAWAGVADTLRQRGEA